MERRADQKGVLTSASNRTIWQAADSAVADFGRRIDASNSSLAPAVAFESLRQGMNILAQRESAEERSEMSDKREDQIARTIIFRILIVIRTHTPGNTSSYKGRVNEREGKSQNESLGRNHMRVFVRRHTPMIGIPGLV
jgi:hypothetical protein